MPITVANFNRYEEAIDLNSVPDDVATAQDPFFIDTEQFNQNKSINFTVHPEQRGIMGSTAISRCQLWPTLVPDAHKLVTGYIYWFAAAVKIPINFPLDEDGGASEIISASYSQAARIDGNPNNVVGPHRLTLAGGKWNATHFRPEGVKISTHSIDATNDMGKWVYLILKLNLIPGEGLVTWWKGRDNDVVKILEDTVIVPSGFADRPYLLTRLGLSSVIWGRGRSRRDIENELADITIYIGAILQAREEGDEAFAVEDIWNQLVLPVDGWNPGDPPDDNEDTQGQLEDLHAVYGLFDQAGI